MGKRLLTLSLSSSVLADRQATYAPLAQRPSDPGAFAIPTQSPESALSSQTPPAAPSEPQIRCCAGKTNRPFAAALCADLPFTQPTFAQLTFTHPTFTQPTFVQPTFVQPTFVQPTFVQLTLHSRGSEAASDAANTYIEIELEKSPVTAPTS